MRTRAERPMQRVPVWAWVLAAVAFACFALPLIGLVWRVPWGDLTTLLGDAAARDAMRLSLVTATVATAIAVVLGIPLAWTLARARVRGLSLVRALCTLPIVLPPVVGGVALFFAFGRRGIVGGSLDEWFGVRIPFTVAAIVMAQVFVAMPFLVVAVEAALRQVDPTIEEAGRTLGGSPAFVFLRVTLPAIRPALVSGVLLCWARALGEFGATITFAGTAPGRTTMPVAIYRSFETDPPAALALALVLVAVALGVLVAVRSRWLGALQSVLARP